MNVFDAVAIFDERIIGYLCFLVKNIGFWNVGFGVGMDDYDAFLMKK